MKTKKLVALVLVAVLAITSVVGGTLAYFKDSDSDVNVMSLGNVNIIQNEKDLEGNDFVDQPMMPAVYPEGTTEENVLNKQTGYFKDGIENMIDKVVTVTNEAEKGAVNQDAYVRTILAFETNTIYKAGTTEPYGPKNGDAHWGYINVAGDFKYLYKDGSTDEFEKITLTVDGEEVEFVLAVKVYADPLAAGATSEPSLKQLFMTPDAGNEIKDLFGEEYTVLALSQATQIAGFADAATALDTAFGDVATNAQAWFADVVA